MKNRIGLVILGVAAIITVTGCGQILAATGAIPEIDFYENDDFRFLASPIFDGEQQERTLSPLGDIDWISFTAIAGEEYTIETSPRAFEPFGGSDTFITVFDPDQDMIDEDDDGGEGLFSSLTFTAWESGTHYVRVRDYSRVAPGGYAIRLSSGSIGTF